MSGETGTRPRRILTVCLGNHCRSPLAAAILTRLAGTGAQVEVRSAGLRKKWVGQPAGSLMLTAAAEFGFDLSAHVGAQITMELIDWADTVLAMDQAVLAELREFARERAAGKLRSYLPGTDIPDPYGQQLEVFRDCVRQVQEGAARHLSEIVGEQ